MADNFLDDGGSNSAPYETPGTSATTLTGLIAGTTVAVDEVIWVKSDHIEAYVANTTISPPAAATVASPQRLLCTSDWADTTPSTINSGAEIQTNGNYQIVFSKAWYLDGITFNPGGGGSPGTGNKTIFGDSTGGSNIVADNCLFKCGYTGATGIDILWLMVGSGSTYETAKITVNNSQFWVNHTNHSCCRLVGNASISMSGVSVHASSSAPAAFVNAGIGNGSFLKVNNSDLSACTNLVNITNLSSDIIFRNSKLPATITTGTSNGPGWSIKLINCDSGDTYTRHETHTYEGVLYVSTSIYATTTPAKLDATTSYSIKMAASANVSRYLPLYSEWFAVWNDAASYTPAIEILVEGDGATALDDDELWIEVDYNNDTGSPKGTRATTLPGILTTPSAVSAGTTAWTGDLYSTERTHKLTVGAFTPDKPGWVYMRVALAKPSAAIYVNPPR